jgi:hypothetical protein
VAIALALVVFGGEGYAQVADEARRRPIPYPVSYSDGYERALQNGTRTAAGQPGPAYWQQWTDYTLRARIDTDEQRLEGSATILYHNNSPDALQVLFINLIQNVHAEGAPRNRPQQVTGGVELERVSVAGQELGTVTGDGPGYRVEATAMEIVPPQPVSAGDSVVIEIDWSFEIPSEGVSNRMGWEDDLFFLAYWYPQMAVYNDVVGWHTDWFMAGSEFYAGFGSYDLTVDVPEDWVVMGTGRLANTDEVLEERVIDRLREAESNDEVVHVITTDDLANGVTKSSDDGRLAWRFVSEKVRDVAFSVTRASLWDAVRTPVGDRDGDGEEDYARIDAIYKENAPKWMSAALYGQHSIKFLSEYTGIPYPWPHMSAVEAGFRGGGMEYPMMTLIGDYNQRTDSALYFVTAHELAHMWVPMIVNTDERRYSWMDEGTTSFNENQARKDFFPGLNHDIPDHNTYLEMAHSGNEGEMMRWSDHHYVPQAFSVASYSKPATVLAALRGVLGEETFLKAYRAYLSTWAYKHPYPWDMFQMFEDVAGRDLDWFWRSWYYETWKLDQAVAAVEKSDAGTRIVIEDRGLIPMPVRLRISFADGSVSREELSVERWLGGATTTEITIRGEREITRVEIDPEFLFPDADRSNNNWTR